MGLPNFTTTDINLYTSLKAAKNGQLSPLQSVSSKTQPVNSSLNMFSSLINYINLHFANHFRMQIAVNI